MTKKEIMMMMAMKMRRGQSGATTKGERLEGEQRTARSRFYYPRLRARALPGTSWHPGSTAVARTGDRRDAVVYVCAYCED